jgi:hypothetical protein
VSPARPAVTAITTGTRIAYDGEAWTVTGIEAGRLLLAGARGRSLLADTVAVLADPSVRLPGAGGDGEPAACGPLLDSLTVAERGELAGRLRHLREVLTGYTSGTPATAEAGEPRPEYDPSLPLLDRYQAKAAELGVSRRTVQRWAAALQDSGPLASLATGIPPGTVPPAIPSSWRPASPALGSRIARARDQWRAQPTGSGTRPRCPFPARRPRARPAPPTWPPPARPGCPISSGQTGRSASPTTPPPPATASSCPPR